MAEEAAVREHEHGGHHDSKAESVSIGSSECIVFFSNQSGDHRWPNEYARRLRSM